MIKHPLPIGARVWHSGQQWAASLPGGTATIVAVKDCGDAYEYQVLTGKLFASPPGPDNPRERVTWWSSRVVAPAYKAC